MSPNISAVRTAMERLGLRYDENESADEMIDRLLVAQAPAD